MIKHRTRRLSVYALLLWTTSFTAGAVQAQDTITLDRRARRGSSKLLGTITDVGRMSVTIRSGDGETRKVPANQVSRIDLRDEPSALRQARQAVMAGQFEQAVDALEAFDLPASARDVLRQEVGYYRAIAHAELALQNARNLKATEQSLMDFLRQERTTFHFFEIVELMGDLATADGRYEMAAKYYLQIGKAPWPDYKLKSLILLGNALRSQGKWQAAAEKYESALQLDVSDPMALRQQTMARIGKASCVAELGEPQQAIKTLESILAKNPDTDGELFAETYLALGSAYRKADLPVDAILAYLHVDLLFYKQREAHAESLYHLAQLWPQVDQPARAVEARKLLRQRYAGSVWSKRAE